MLYIYTIVWLHHMKSNEMLREKAKLELPKNDSSCFGKLFEAASHKRAAVKLPVTIFTNYPRWARQGDTAGDIRMNS